MRRSNKKHWGSGKKMKTIKFNGTHYEIGLKQGKFYKKEDVIVMLSDFINTFSPVANTIKEMVAFYRREMKVFLKDFIMILRELF